MAIASGDEKVNHHANAVIQAAARIKGTLFCLVCRTGLIDITLFLRYGYFCKEDLFTYQRKSSAMSVCYMHLLQIYLLQGVL